MKGLRIAGAILLANFCATNLASAAPAPISALAGLNKRLDVALKSLGDSISPLPEYYVAAKGKLSETEALIIDAPKSDDRPRWEKACSLYVQAAELQIGVRLAHLKTADVTAQRLAVLTELGNSMDEINKLERGYSSSLRADLEEQKRQVNAARAEADKRFDELNSALIQVKKDARGTIISMSDILFDVGKATLTQDLKTSLAKIAGILTIYKDANVVVEGHTDNQGGEDLNQKLSEKRAENVMNFLITPGGIAAKRLSSVGYGFSKPIADNATKEGRQKNRRVDLVISDPALKGP